MNGIILIVVMRHEWSTAFVADGLVVGIEVTKVPPAVFIDDFPPIEKGIGSGDRCIDQLQTFDILILISWREIIDGFRVCIAVWGRARDQSIIDPAKIEGRLL